MQVMGTNWLSGDEVDNALIWKTISMIDELLNWLFLFFFRPYHMQKKSTSNTEFQKNQTTIKSTDKIKLNLI